MNLRILVGIILLVCRARRYRHRLTNRCLPIQQHSAWESIWKSQDEDGLYHTTGFDMRTFRIIHDAICYDLYSFGTTKGGRPSRLDTYATTALALYYLHRYIDDNNVFQRPFFAMG